MKRTRLAAMLPAVVGLAACRQLAGLDDRPGIHDAGVEVTSVPTDATTTASVCATTDASFCDDFASGDLDAGWTEKVEEVADAGPVASLSVGADGVFRATGLALPTGGFHDARLFRSFTTSAQRVSLSFSIFVHAPSFVNDQDVVQLALLTVPGSIAYPALNAHGLFFTYTTTDGAYVEHVAETFFDFEKWHRMTLVYDLGQHTVAAQIDESTAMTPATFEPSGNTGGYGIAIGLRMQGNSTAIEVRYDDVVVDLR